MDSVQQICTGTANRTPLPQTFRIKNSRSNDKNLTWRREYVQLPKHYVKMNLDNGLGPANVYF